MSVERVGMIERGVLQVNEEIEIVGTKEKSFKTVTVPRQAQARTADAGRYSDGRVPTP